MEYDCASSYHVNVTTQFNVSLVMAITAHDGFIFFLIGPEPGSVEIYRGIISCTHDADTTVCEIANLKRKYVYVPVFQKRPISWSSVPVSSLLMGPQYLLYACHEILEHKMAVGLLEYKNDRYLSWRTPYVQYKDLTLETHKHRIQSSTDPSFEHPGCGNGRPTC